MLTTEEKLTVSDAAALLDKSEDSVQRWHSHGLRGVRLRIEVHGGTVVTCRAWIDSFFKAVQAAREKAKGGHHARKRATRKLVGGKGRRSRVEVTGHA
jgi:hypothetical protein